MSTLADLLVKIGVDNSGVDKGGKETQSKFERTFSKVQAAAAVAGAAAGAALITGLTGALDTEKAADKLAASLGATGQEAEDLGRRTSALYAKGLGESADEVATAVGAVATSIKGLNGEAEVEATTEKVINLAKAFEIDVSRAAQVAGQAVTSGLAKDASSALDLITSSLQSVPAAVREDLLDAVDEYGPFLSSIGVTGEKAFGLLVKGAEKGMYGIDKTGDALKEFTIRATDMSKASKVGFDAIGLSQEKMAGQLLKGGETGAKAFDKIITGLRGIKDPVKQSQAALALFGTPLEDLSVAEIPKFLEGLDSAESGLFEVAGSTDQLGETLNDNAATKLEAFKRSVQQALVEKLADAIPYIEKTFGWLQANSGWVVPLVTGLGAFAAVIYTITLAMKAWAAIQAVLNLALWTSPITWIIAGVLLLVAAVILIATKTDWFQKAWAWAWGGIKAAALAVARWFSGPFVGFFTGAWDKIKSWTSSAINWFKGLPGKMRRALSGLWDGVKSSFRSAINWVIGKWNNFSLTLGGGSVLGIGIPSVTLNTPNIPYLADGGIVPATPGGRLVRVAEAGQDEAVVPLPRGMRDMGGGSQKVEIELSGTGSLATLFLGAIRRGEIQLNVRNGKVVAANG